MTGDDLPPDSAVIARTGPWTVLSCVTASRSRCGMAPLDEDTGMTPHFGSAVQAREELTGDWGWRCTTRSNWPQDDELLCPGCAKAGDGGRARPAAVTAGENQVLRRGGKNPARPWAAGFPPMPASLRPPAAHGTEAERCRG